MHLVTVPRPGAPKTLLWERFAETFGLDQLTLDLHAERANPSLGAPETALVRRINKAANDVVEPSDYRPLVRELVAHNTLSQRVGSPRLSVPADVWTWADDLSRRWVDELRKRGYAVAGDLDELLPEPVTVPFSDPDRPRESDVSEAAVDAIKALLVESSRQRKVEDDLRAELRETQLALERSYLRPTYRAREKIVRSAEEKGWGRKLMRAYRRARGRSSLSA